MQAQMMSKKRTMAHSMPLLIFWLDLTGHARAQLMRLSNLKKEAPQMTQWILVSRHPKVRLFL